MTRSRPATFAAVLVAGFVSASAVQAQFTVPAFMVPKIPNLVPALPTNSPTIPAPIPNNIPNSPNPASFGIILGSPQLTTPMIPNSPNTAIPQTNTSRNAASTPDSDNQSFRLIIGGDPKASGGTTPPANTTSTTPANSAELSNLSLVTSLAAVQSAIQGVRRELAAEGVPPGQIDRLILQIITQGNNPYSGTTGQVNSLWSGLHQHSRVGSASSANAGSMGHTATAGGSTRIGTGTTTGTHTTTPTTSKPTSQHSPTTHPQQTKTTGKINR